MNSSSPIPIASGIDDEHVADAFTTTHDWSGDVPLSTTILSLVTKATGLAPEELAPLNDIVDPDALDNLFAPRGCGTARPAGAVSFEFEDLHVSIGRDGTVNVRSA